MVDLQDADATRREQGRAWEQKYMAPFRAKSMDRIQRELANVQILRVPGAHDSFFLTSRAQVVTAMRQFLGGISVRQARQAHAPPAHVRNAK
jgi:hypothetical protein